MAGTKWPVHARSVAGARSSVWRWCRIGRNDDRSKRSVRTGHSMPYFWSIHGQLHRVHECHESRNTTHWLKTLNAGSATHVESIQSFHRFAVSTVLRKISAATLGPQQGKQRTRTYAAKDAEPRRCFTVGVSSVSTNVSSTATRKGQAFRSPSSRIRLSR